MDVLDYLQSDCTHMNAISESNDPLLAEMAGFSFRTRTVAYYRNTER